MRGETEDGLRGRGRTIGLCWWMVDILLDGDIDQFRFLALTTRREREMSCLTDSAWMVERVGGRD